MRDYGKVSPQFWTGRTGRAIRAAGPDAQIVALYLMTAPGASMTGLYYLPVQTIAYETGLPFQGASKGLASLSEVGFAEYDAENEVVWVREMAAHQIAEVIKTTDNRHIAIVKESQKLAYSSVYAGWFARYREPYSLPEAKPLPSPFQAPPKPRAGSGEGAGSGAQAGESGLPAVVASATPAEGSDDPPAKVATKRQPRVAKVAPPIDPLPFTIEVALEAIATASGGKFAIPRGGEFRRQHLGPLTRMIRSIPDLGAWERVGRWLASGVIRRPDLGVAWLIGSDAFALSRAWEETRPPAAPTLFEETDPIEIARQEYRARLGLRVAS